jgi:hypothetical protein
LHADAPKSLAMVHDEPDAASGNGPQGSEGVCDDACIRRTFVTIVIIGGGYLGQLLHTLLPEARVFDWRPRAPEVSERSYGPQYLWTPIPKLPCVEFPVVTQVDGRDATDEAILAYKRKVGKEQDKSDWRSQFRPVMRGFDATLPAPRVEYGMRVDKINLLSRQLHVNGEVLPYDWLVSTIPLPAILGLCGKTIPKDNPFESRAIYVTQMPAEAKSYMNVNYISDPTTPVYRVTIRSGVQFTESLEPIANSHRLIPGKIYKHNLSPTYRAELFQARVMTVGRYGAWNPEELAHETYANVRDWKDRIGL